MHNPTTFLALSTAQHDTNSAMNQPMHAAQVLVKTKNKATRNIQQTMDKTLDLLGSAPATAPKPPSSKAITVIKEEKDTATAGVMSTKIICDFSNQFALESAVNSYDSVITDCPTTKELQLPMRKLSNIIFG